MVDFRILMKLARALSLAEKRGNKEEIERAKKEHDDYRALCLKSDKMYLGITKGQL